MRQLIIELIQAKDWQRSLQWAKELSNEDRYTTLDILLGLETDEYLKEESVKNGEYYKRRSLAIRYFDYLVLLCLRTKKEYNADKSDKIYRSIISLLCKGEFGVEPLLEYFKLFSPKDYLSEVYKKLREERFYSNSYQYLWLFYKEQLLPFDEEFFVSSMFKISEGDIDDDIRFLKKYPEIIDKVLLQFYKYELPILERATWTTSDGWKPSCEYWSLLFSALLDLELIKDRSIVGHLINTLNNNWKKGHLDWHIRLLNNIFRVTKEEYLLHQPSLFASLSSTNNTVVGHIIKVADTIYQEENFDAEIFIQNLPSLFIREKCDKAILIALKITDYLLDKYSHLQANADVLINALAQPTNTIQVAAAELLIKYLSKDQIQEQVIPLAGMLKQTAKEILSIKDHAIEIIPVGTIGNESLVYPTTWEDLLFHIGKTLTSQNVVDIDIMYESIVQLQDQLPSDYIKQLKPYIQKLEKISSSGSSLFIFLADFFSKWVGLTPKYDLKRNLMFMSMPFVEERSQWTLEKLNKKDKLPFLSSPTHAPFYIHPDTLISRLLEYEVAKANVPLTDLIVACNRILKTNISDNTKQQARALKGYYGKAICYLLDITDHIEWTEDTLPLWTQIARTKDPNGIFSEFETSLAKGYPTVIHPFILSYEVKRRYSDDQKYHWDYLFIEHNWTNVWTSEKITNSFPPLFLYTGYNGYKLKFSWSDMEYVITLLPHYADAILLMYCNACMTGNEVYEIECCLRPLRYVYENQIRMHHSGWIYIAFCLLFEKKPSRQLAAEYIKMAFDFKFIPVEYLSDVLATMLMDGLAPVNRFIEFLDQFYSRDVESLKKCTLGKCIEVGKTKEKLPTNYKKLLAYHQEFNNKSDQK